METRDIIQVVGALCTIAASLGVSKHQVGQHDAKIDSHDERIAGLETETALLKQEQGSHRRQIDDLVTELRAAVLSLQRVAIDLAVITGKAKE